MAATLVIFLREGIEASMIVAILLAYLDRIGQRRHFADVLLGVGAALALAAAGGVAAYYTIRTYAGSSVQTIFETCTYLLAAAVLTYMTFWMRNHARTISDELRAKTDAALDGAGDLSKGARRGLALIAFQAVGREGLESAVFTLAIIFSTSASGALLGAGIGLAIAMCLAFAIYRLGKHLNIARFFTVLGAVLMVFAAGLLVDAVENMQHLGWLPFLRQHLWDSGRVLSEDSAFGDIIHSFFGYVSRPTPLELLVWVLYVAAAVASFLGLWRRRPVPATVTPLDPSWWADGTERPTPGKPDPAARRPTATGALAERTTPPACSAVTASSVIPTDGSTSRATVPGWLPRIPSDTACPPMTPHS